MRGIALSDGVSENDNASVAALYNKVDQITARLNCCWINIHHSSKGEQGQKAVTDVAPARAVKAGRLMPISSCGRTKSKAPSCSRPSSAHSSRSNRCRSAREFPLWTPDDMLDPAAVRGRLTKQEERQSEKNQQAIAKMAEALSKGPATPKILRGLTGHSDKPLQRILDLMESQGMVTWTPIKKGGNETREYRLTPTDD